MPRVSIITPLFNKGPYVGRTLASVRAQTMADWEMIVVDNGSTDDGPAVAAKIAAADARIAITSFRDTQGPGAARNHALAHAQGEWVLFLDADDLIEPGHLAALLADAARHPAAAIVAGHWQEFSGEEPTQTVLQKPFCFGQDVAALRDACVAFAPWAVHAVLTKRAALRRELWWPEELDRGLGEDIHFWFRLLLEHDVAFSTNAGALYRVHTVGRRNQVGVIASWYRGNDLAALANVHHLERTGRPLTAGQCMSLMRLYSELYWQARSQRDRAIAREARTKAERWLRAAGGGHGWSMHARRLLGLPLYLSIRYGLLGKPAHW